MHIDSFLTELVQSMKEFLLLLRFSQLLSALEQPHAWNKWFLWHWALNGWAFSHILGPCDALPWQGPWPTDDCGKFNALKENPQRCPLLVRLHSTFSFFSHGIVSQCLNRVKHKCLLAEELNIQKLSTELMFTLLFTHRQRHHELHYITAIL